MPLSENEATMDIPTPRSYIEFVRIVAATESGLASVAIQFISNESIAVFVTDVDAAHKRGVTINNDNFPVISVIQSAG